MPRVPVAPTTRTAARDRFDAETLRFEGEFAQVARALFVDDAASVVATLRALYDASPTSGAVRNALALMIDDFTSGDGDRRDAWYEAFRSLLEDTYQVAGDGISAMTGFDFALRNGSVQDAIESRASDLADLVGETTSDRIVDVMAEWRTSGDGVRSLADAIKADVFDGDITDARAQRIARTESAIAYNTAEFTTAQDSGVIESKEWLTQGDDRVRDSHAELDGVVIGIDEVFANGLMYPGDPNGDPGEIINCRCTLLYHDQSADDVQAESDDAGDGG